MSRSSKYSVSLLYKKVLPKITELEIRVMIDKSKSKEEALGKAIKEFDEELDEDDLFELKKYTLSFPWFLVNQIIQWHFNCFQLPEDQYINKKDYVD